MRAIIGHASPLALVLLLTAAPSFAQEQPAAPPPPPRTESTVQVQVQPAPQQQAAPQPPPPPPADQQGAPQASAPQQAPYQGQEAPPPGWVQVDPQGTGQWVYTPDYGWVWVPAGTVSQDAEGVPYSYLYTPTYGWTWYVSPWGVGPYYYGGWVRHPWHPVGWRGGWVAQPRVFVRLGGHAGYGYGARGRVYVGGGRGVVHVGHGRR
jgi:hypothetical protein